MRPDRLLVTRTTTHKQITTENVNVKAVVMKGFNEPSDTIEIETISGLAKIKQRETALMNISFQGGKQFNGTFRDLEKALETANKFPNGFVNWMETHHEVVSSITTALNKREGTSEAEKIAEREGTHGVWTLAEQITDAFEAKHKGVEWDIDEKYPSYYEAIEDFVHTALYKD